MKAAWKIERGPDFEPQAHALHELLYCGSDDQHETVARTRLPVSGTVDFKI